MEIQRADPRLRKLTIVLVAAATLVALGVILLFDGWLAEVQTLPLDSAMPKLRQALLGLLVLAGVAMATAAAWFWHMGTAVMAARRFPAPGKRVVRDTPVLEGEAATRRGRLLRAAALIMLLADAVFLYLCWKLWAMLAPQMS